MKVPAIALALLFVAPMVIAQAGGGEVAVQQVQKVTFSDAKLEKFANAYRSIVDLSREYAPKIKASKNIEETEALNQEAQGKMLSAVKAAGLSKEEYQEIANRLKTDQTLVKKINKLLQKQQ
ncbi:MULTISPECIES: DUF4168 domain-containing protein [unclassified Microbulbifer]|uniref:DUF4168 domain-containing protein n=1 Tax=unclassified Microbulbifer TaxID=2619833 RepID=UPI0027E55A14|nr:MULTISPECIES: DUF4168 domain-containing protein [unclassified Microbulbifer]